MSLHEEKCSTLTKMFHKHTNSNQTKRDFSAKFKYRLEYIELYVKGQNISLLVEAPQEVNKSVHPSIISVVSHFVSHSMSQSSL